jgi:hypothetical protein
MQHLAQTGSGAERAEVCREDGAQQAEEENQERASGEREAKDQCSHHTRDDTEA